MEKLFYIPFFLMAAFLYKNNVNSKYFWIISSLLIISTKLVHENYLWYMNPDEIEWCVKSRSLVETPSLYFSEFIFVDFTRFFTILPLSIFIAIFGSCDPLICHLLQILFYLTTFYLLERIFTELNCRHTRYVSFVFLLFYLSQEGGDVIAYNSELPSMCLLLLGVYLFQKSIYSNWNKVLEYLSGFMVVASCFAKEQIAPLSILVSLFILYRIISTSNCRNLFVYLLGLATIPILLIFGSIYAEKTALIFLFTDSFLNYKKIGLANKSTAPSVMNLMVKSVSVFYHFYKPIIILTFLTIVLFLKNFSLTKSIIIKSFFIAILGVVIFYLVTAPGNLFAHYFNYGYMIFFTLLCYTLEWLEINKLQKFKIVLIIFCTITIKDFASNYATKETDKVSSWVQTPKKIISLTRETMSKEKSFCYVHGWMFDFYLKTGLNRTSIQVNPLFQLDNFNNSKDWQESLNNEIYTIKPSYILEAVGPDVFYYNDTMFKIQNINPELKHYMSRNYSLIFKDNSYQLFQIKSE